MSKRNLLSISGMVMIAGILTAAFPGPGARAAAETTYVAVAVAPDGTIPSVEADARDKQKKRRRGMRTTASPDAAVPVDGTPSKRRIGMHTAEPYAVATGAVVPAAVVGTVRKDVVGMVPPDGRLEGSVLAKDGVTRLPRADIVLDHRLFHTQHRVTSDRDGSFGIDLPLGPYAVKIVERHSIYESPSTYVIPAHKVLAVDFLLLRDFEDGTEGSGGRTVPARETAAGGVAEATARGTDSARWLPEPPREPEVVGSVVDLVSPPVAVTHPERGKWRETLGFLGSILLIAVIAF